MFSKRLGVVSLVCLALLGCTSSSQEGASEVVDPGDEICVATMSFWQKDAYRTSAGRSNPLWPPHTSTQFDVLCGGVRVAGGMNDNHGTLPDELDADGSVILQRVASLAAEGKRSELEAVAESYRSCECGTTPVSLDSLDDEGVEELLSAVGDYVEDNMGCSGPGGVMALTARLEQGEIESMLGELANCTWASGANWATAFDSALSSTIASTETTDDFHVCNNDALLQGQLLQQFAASGNVGPCDGLNELCTGPLWYYEP